MNSSFQVEGLCIKKTRKPKTGRMRDDNLSIRVESARGESVVFSFLTNEQFDRVIEGQDVLITGRIVPRGDYNEAGVRVETVMTATAVKK